MRNALGQVSSISVVAIVTASTLTALSGASAAVKLKSLYSFCNDGASCRDGHAPQSPLLRDGAGNLYGSTYEGGDDNSGVIFMLAWDGTKFHYHTLYRFCRKVSCTDGAQPSGGLIIDTVGNLYGTTSTGGKYGGGTPFELRYDSAQQKWSHSTLYDFCAQQPCPDGFLPTGLTYDGQQSGAPYDGASVLYGSAYGGLSGGGIFQLTYAADQTRRKQKVVYYFCSQPNCTDGQLPQFATFDSAGNLLGTTQFGGSANHGTVFELSPAGKTWAETVLYSFCSQANCADGDTPAPSLVQDSRGHLFGTAIYGGANTGAGVAFKLVPNGVNSTYAVLYNFCAAVGCADGAHPTGGVTLVNGTLFGTTSDGGAPNDGTIFRIKAGVSTKLYEFCTQAGCSDGQGPTAPMAVDPSGNLFGTTQNGGVNGSGTVFELKP